MPTAVNKLRTFAIIQESQKDDTGAESYNLKRISTRSTVAVSPDAQVIASSSRDKTIKLWKK